MKTITITVSPVGDTSIKTEGFSGSSCKEATAAIEKALGKTVSDTPTAEAQSGKSIQTTNRS